MQRKYWILKGPQVIFNLQHELMIATQFELGFKFKLKFVIAALSKLVPHELVQYERVSKNKEGKVLGIAWKEVLLTLKVKTSYQGEYLRDPVHQLMFESFVGRCLDDFLFPLPNVPESHDPYGYDFEISLTEYKIHNLNNHMEDQCRSIVDPTLYIVSLYCRPMIFYNNFKRCSVGGNTLHFVLCLFVDHFIGHIVLWVMYRSTMYFSGLIWVPTC